MSSEQEVRAQLFLVSFFIAALTYQDGEGIKENIRHFILFLQIILFLCISQRRVSKLEYAM